MQGYRANPVFVQVLVHLELADFGFQVRSQRAMQGRKFIAFDNYHRAVNFGDYPDGALYFFGHSQHL